MSTKNIQTRRTPSPSPTVTLDTIPQPKLYRSSSEESIRVLHHAVLFPTSPHATRVSYVRRTMESDSELVKRQLAMIATQPLTFAEELAVKRKQLEMRVDKRKRDKAATTPTDGKMTVPEITIVPASGKLSPSPISPTKLKTRASFKEKGNVNTKIPKPTPVRIQRPRVPLRNTNNKQGVPAINNISINKSPVPSPIPIPISPSPILKPISPIPISKPISPNPISKPITPSHSPTTVKPTSPLPSPKRKPSIDKK